MVLQSRMTLKEKKRRRRGEGKREGKGRKWREGEKQKEEEKEAGGGRKRRRTNNEKEHTNYLHMYICALYIQQLTIHRERETCYALTYHSLLSFLSLCVFSFLFFSRDNHNKEHILINHCPMCTLTPLCFAGASGLARTHTHTLSDPKRGGIMEERQPERERERERAKQKMKRRRRKRSRRRRKRNVDIA